MAARNLKSCIAALQVAFMNVCCALAMEGHAHAVLSAPDLSPHAERVNDGASKESIRSHFASVPLAFEENRGQFESTIRYVAHGSGQTLFLTSNEAIVALQPDPSHPASVVRMRFAGSADTAMPAGEEALATRTHYFTARDVSGWRTDVPSFGRVRYRDLYPGIDVVYYGNHRQLEYDFVLAPGANPRRIQLRFDGAAKIDIDREGDLIVTTSGGVLTHKKPVAWQLAGGDRRAVDARFARHGDDIGIDLAAYDRQQPLTIDPQVVFYATYLGGVGSDKALAIAADAAGNTYVAGLTQSINFPLANAAQPAKSGASDAFVAKLNKDGTALIFATYLGGSGVDAALGIARDAAGNSYVTGYTASSDFPVTQDALQSNLHGSAYDAFVTELGADGSLQYSTYLGGSNIDSANAIALDGLSNIYVAGSTCSADFPIGNAFQPQLVGAAIGCFAAKDAFVAKFQVGAPGLSYSTYLGGNGGDEANAIAVDAQGRASITGTTTSLDFPLAGVALYTHAGDSDAFVSRFSTSGSLDYSTYYGGSGGDKGLAIATGGAYSLYMAGSTRSVDFPTVYATQPALHGPQDAFVVRIDLQTEASTSATVVYSTYLGGRDEDAAHGIAVDGFGYAVVTGETRSLDFPTVAPGQPALHGLGDAFLTRIRSNGVVTHSTFLGGDNEDAGWGVALSNGPMRATSNVHIGGVTLSSDLATGGVVQPTPQGSYDGFVSKLGYVP